MSQENVEIVRRFIDALARQDYEDAIGRLHEDASWHNTAAFPSSGEIVGPQAVIAFSKALVESFDPATSRTEIMGLKARGDQVVADVHSCARGARSGVPIDARYAFRITLRANLIERVDVSGDYAKALEAAGLSE